MIGPAAVLVATAMVAALLTGAMLKLAQRHDLLDVPDRRSSHAAPVPLGGGVAIAVVVCGWLLVEVLRTGGVASPWFLVFLGGTVLAVIGYVDDRHRVSKRLRLASHAASVAALLWATRELGPLAIPGLPAVVLLHEIVALGALIWLLNLYNFMDGIDGIAAVEAIVVSLGLAAALWLGPGAPDDLLLVCVVTAGASLGFLVWNWPPARIFMGDAGSGLLGFLFGALAVIAHRTAGLSLWVPAILLAVFVTDATLTLLRRMIRRERWYEAHRRHAYQALSRRWSSHRRVTLVVLAVDVLWLAPLAVFAARHPDMAGLLAFLAYLPIVLGALLAGAGRPESVTS